MADKKISEFPIFDGAQDAQTYYILASGEAGDPDADNYKMPFTHLAQDITANISLYSGLSGVFDHLTSGASGIFTEVISGKMISGTSGVFSEEIILDGKKIVQENAQGGVDLGSTQPPAAGTDAPPVNLLHGGEEKIHLDDDIIKIGGANNDPTDQVEIINSTTIKETFTVADGKDTTLGGNTTIKGTTNLDSSLTVADGQDTILGGATTIKGATTFDSTANFTDSTKITFGSSTPAQTLQDIIDAGGKWSDGDSSGDIVYNAGNVGIGTSDPQTELHVAGDVRASSIGLNTDIGYSAVFSKTNQQPAIKFMGINSGVGLNYSLGVDAIDGNNNKFHINRIDDADGFKQNLLTIKSDGNVGIGTSNPVNGMLEILNDTQTTATTDSIDLAITQNGSGTSSKVQLRSGVTLGKDPYFAIRTRDNLTQLGGGQTSGGDIVERMRITHEGNVGIGTTSPAGGDVSGKALEIKSSAASILRLNRVNGQGAAVQDFSLYAGSTAFELHDNKANETRLVIKDGNVGIGTTGPSDKLSLPENSGITWMRADNTDESSIANNEDDLIIKSSRGTGSIILDTNSVGIGTTGPGAKLEVAEDPISNGNDLAPKKVLTLMRSEVSGVTYAQRANFFLRKYEGASTSGINTQARTQLDIALAHSNGQNGEVSNIDGSNERVGGTAVLSLRSDGMITIGGSLGVGTTPQEKFHVNGTVKLDDTPAPTTKTNKLYANAGKLYWNGAELASGSSSNFAAVNHTHTWSEITSKPSTFTPSTHTHTWSEITSKPANFTPSSHNLSSHSDVTITSAQSDQILYYNGTRWVNSAPSEPAFISDKKYKLEIFPISDALLKVNSIRGANFTWSDDAPSDLSGKKDVGVIAQDIQKILPEAVEEKENGDLTVKYHRIIPLLIESIKELSEENKALKSRLDKIEGIS